ncbi:MAG: FecR domain-containing protein [Pseudomonadota bacterium]
MRTVHQAREEAHLWRVRREAGLSDAEQREFAQWMAEDARHRELYAEAQIVWHGIGNIALDPSLRPQTEAASVAAQQASIKLVDQKPSRLAGLFDLFGPRTFAGAVLASVMLAFVFFADIPTMLSSTPESEVLVLSTERGQRKLVTLPDGSKVTLGAASEMRLELSEGQRLAYLDKGNAYFDVAKDADRPFIAHTGLVDVRVTGTKFDIQSSEDMVAVAVGEGSVELMLPRDSAASNSPMQLSLKAGEQVMTTAGIGFGSVSELFPAEFAAWRTGRLLYLRAPLSRIITDLNRYSDTPIAVDAAVSDLLVTGAYDAGDTDAILQELVQGLPISVVTTDNGQRIVAR